MAERSSAVNPSLREPAYGNGFGVDRSPTFCGRTGVGEPSGRATHGPDRGNPFLLETVQVARAPTAKHTYRQAKTLELVLYQLKEVISVNRRDWRKLKTVGDVFATVLKIGAVCVELWMKLHGHG